MDKFTLATIAVMLVLVALPSQTSSQCPLECKTCTTTNGSTCNSNVCANNFYNDTPSNSCLVNTTWYNAPLDTADGSITVANMTTCGTLFPNPMPGNFSPATEYDFYLDTALLPHYSYRVVASVLFVGVWQTSNTISLYVDLINITSLSYGGTTNMSSQSYS